MHAATEALAASAGKGREPAHGKPSPERKPTEKLLNALISSYLKVYRLKGRAAVEAALRVLREQGKQVRAKDVEEAFLEASMPLVEDLMPYVEDAIRLGAARVKDPRETRALLELIVREYAEQVREARAYWLRKMARDFTKLVLKSLGVEGSNSRAHSTAGASPGNPPSPGEGFTADTLDDVLEDALRDFSTEDDADVGVYEFEPDFLNTLLQKGYTFIEVRAVEATEHDIWKGDDVGYIRVAAGEGVIRFRWRVSPDDKVCPICQDFDAMEVDAQEAERMSADRGVVSHCRCRCWWEAVDSTTGTARSDAGALPDDFDDLFGGTSE